MSMDVCDRDFEQAVILILTKFCTQVLWCKLSIEFIKKRNRFHRFKMVAGIDTSRTV